MFSSRYDAAVTQHRVLVDIQFTVDNDQFKVAQLSDDATGVSEVTEAAIRNVVGACLTDVDWAKKGLAPLRAVVTMGTRTPSGDYAEVLFPAEPGIMEG